MEQNVDKKGAMSSGSDRSQILILGDDSDGIDILTNILVGKGYGVTVVESVDSLFSHVAESTPALVIVDTQSSSPDASSLCDRFLANEGTENMPILVVCGEREDTEWSAGHTGFADFIRRPYTREDMLARVRVMLRLRKLTATVNHVRGQLMHSQKMECIGALAAGVAHEFNNLMFAVMGFAELAREDGADDVEALRESAEVSYQTAKRAAATAASLLAFSKQSEGAKRMGDVNDAVKAALKLLRRDITKTGIRIETNLGELPETNFGFGPIQQVFLNLIINAWHAMRVQEKARVLAIESVSEAGCIKVSVSDTGTGIKKDDVERIFEPFFTTKAGMGAETGGSGLGLSIVREVVRDHGGKVRVESKAGEGTKFIVEIPVMVEEVRDDKTKRGEAAGDGAHYSALVVDDEEASRRVISRILAKSGHSAYLASNMAEAMTLIVSRDIDVIIMDMIMPDGDGATNVMHLRSEGIETPILMCTGNVERERIDLAMSNGANGIIMKPFSSAEFMEKLKACLAK